MCGERKAQGMCDRNGGARRGARPPHVWRAVRDAYSVNSGGRRVERGIVRWKPAARRATRYEQGGSGWVRAAHCARREMNRGRGGERGRCAAEAPVRGARRVRRVMSEGGRGRCEARALRAARNFLTSSERRRASCIFGVFGRSDHIGGSEGQSGASHGRKVNRITS